MNICIIDQGPGGSYMSRDISKYKVSFAFECMNGFLCKKNLSEIAFCLHRRFCAGSFIKDVGIF